MFDVSDAHRFRKTIAGLCMIGAPILFLASSLIVPGFDSDESAFAGLIAGDADAWNTAQVLALGGWALFMCAVLGLMHMLRERGTREGHLGGAVALIGTVAALAQCGYGLALGELAKGSAESTAALMTSVNDNALTMVALFIVPLGVTIGGVVLAWALYRHHMVPVWIAAGIGGSAILYAVGAFTFSQELYIAASAVLLVGSGALGMNVLRESVEDWEHTPALGAH